MANNHDQLISKFLKDPDYQIESDGTVKKRIRKKDPKFKKPIFKKVGYLKDTGYIVICYQNKHLKLHRIIWAKFGGSLSSKLVINHKDGVKTNNSIDNLEMVTQSDNVKHAFKFLKIKQPRAKFSWNQVEDIRKNYGSEEYTRKKLSERYQVSGSTIDRIVNGTRYLSKDNHRTEPEHD